MFEKTNVFEKLFEHSLDGVLLSRPDGTILRANPAACHALGRTEDEIRREGRRGLVVEDAALLELLAERQTTGAVAGELTFRRPDGSTFPAEFTSGLIPSNDGAPYAYVIFRDVSERRRMEERHQGTQEALRRSETTLHSIADAVPDPVFLKDREGRWTFANPALLKVVGKSLDQVLGRTDREIYSDPAIGEALAEIDRGVMESGVAEVVEERVQTADGYRVFLSSKAPLRAKDGRVVGIVGSARDITDRKRAEEALRQREHLLSASQRAAHVGTWGWKVGDKTVHWSEETFRIYGLPVSPDGGRMDYDAFFELVHPEDRSKMREWSAALLARHPPRAIEFRVLRPDGSVRVIRTEGDVIETVDGVPTRIAGTAHDVTEQRQVEEALRESENEARHAASRLKVLADASKAFVEAGLDVGAVLDQLAWRLSEALGDTCQVAMLSEDGEWLTLAAVHSRYREVEDCLRALGRERADSSPLLLRVLRTGEPALVPALTPEQLLTSLPPQRRAIYERHPPHTFVMVALRAQGRTLGLLALTRYRGERPAFTEDDLHLAQDLADRAALTIASAQHLEQARRDLDGRIRAEADRERLTMAIEQAAEEVVITDTHGTIVYVNPAFEAVTGYSRAEVLGQNPRILKSGVHDAALYRALWETITSGKTWHGRMVNRKKDGSLHTEDVTVSPVRDASGTIASFVAVKRDITRDLALEAQLFQSQKMEGIGRLAGGVAHDFNNLLSVILTCAEFALGTLREGDPLGDDLREIERAGQRAATLTRQLLAFSRKQVMQPEPLDLNRLVGELEKMLGRILGEDVDLVQVLAPDLGIVKADPGQLEQVIMNLVVNARDAMPDGGKLTIETANVYLDEQYAAQHLGATVGPHVMLAISDSGVGMDEGTMARAFEPFFTTKGAGKGTGLGLATVYGIVKQTGGSIYVYSELGKGTTFKVYLPRELSFTPAVKGAAPSARSGGAETILVVEDDEQVRNVAKRILAGAGYRVLTAANGGEGLLLCEQHPEEIHLVLTDVVMPLMGGRIFVERLVKVRPAIKVLYMSGYTDNAIVHHGVLDEGTQFISKPLGQVELLRKVRTVLDG